MILIDTSLYIQAVRDASLEDLLEQLSRKTFVQSCVIIENEIDTACEFLRRTDRKQEAEKLKLIYGRVRQGNIRATERIITLADDYHRAAREYSKQQHKDIANDFLIVASAAVAGIKNILSLNRKTMASLQMIRVYAAVNAKNRYPTPRFFMTADELRSFLKSL